MRRNTASLCRRLRSLRRPSAWPGDAQAQSYPTRPIHLVTGNPPGGATDFIARAIGQPLSVRLGQSVVIDNRPGANGNISAEVVAKSAPDGYTLLYANDSLVVVNPHIYSKMSVNVMQDLVPVVTTISNQLVLAVNPQVVPVNDFPGIYRVCAQAQPRPCSMPRSATAATPPGDGNSEAARRHRSHACALQGRRTGLDRRHRRRERADVRRHVRGQPHQERQAEGACGVRQQRLADHARTAGDRRILSGLQKRAVARHLCAARERRRPSSTSCARSSTPCLSTPEVKERLITGGAGEPYITTPDEFAAVMRADYERYGTVIKSIGFKVDLSVRINCRIR